MNVSDVVVKIKKAGPKNVRCTPMNGEKATDGMYQIELHEGVNWNVILSGIPRTTAFSLVDQATERVIFG